LRGVERPKVGLAARDFSDVSSIYRCFDIADIGKALSAQQLLGDVQRGNAEATLLQPNVVVSRGPSAASAQRVRIRPAVPAAAMPLRKVRRVWISAITWLPLFTPSARV